MPRPKLVLIDGSSYLFRAFHALPPLSNAAGEPTGALFGVVNMLRATIQAKPDRLAFVLDASGPTFRHEMFPEYKANRSETPSDLVPQVEPMVKIVEALGIPLLRVGGVEADDVIGTLARQASAGGYDVEISTSDKDFAQLVDGTIVLVNTMLRPPLRTDVEGVVAKWGVRPEQIADLLALMGDTVDNVPGVDKCGPKTAAKWLADWGTLENVLANAGKIGGKVGENLRAVLDRLPLSKRLTTIRTDVELPCVHDALKLRDPDVATLRALYTRYEFGAALKELDRIAPTSASDKPPVDVPPPDSSAEPPPPPKTVVDRSRYECVVDEDAFAAWLAKLAAAPAFAFHAMATTHDAHQASLVGVAFAIAPNEACYVPFGHTDVVAPRQLPMQRVLDAVRPLLEDPARAKLAIDAKHQSHVLVRHGVVPAGLVLDPMLESYVWNATVVHHDLEAMALRYLGYQSLAYSDVAGKGAKRMSFGQVPLDNATAYAAESADLAVRLHARLQPRLEALPALERVYRTIEQPLGPVLARMERRGILIDAATLRAQSTNMKTRMADMLARAHASAGHPFSLDSPKQLQQVLFQELKLPIKQRTATGQPSTAEDALADLASDHELPQLILDYRSLAKLVGTYTDKLPEQINPDTGRVHTTFQQAVAATGRLSSADPNLQNIPIRTEDGRRIRTAFVAPPGHRIVAADYSQIELRIMAHLSQDPGLLRAFRDGIDVHRATAGEVFGLPPDQVDANQRRAAKAINFGLMYGMGAFGLAQQIGVSRHQAQEYMDLYFTRFAGVRELMERVRERARTLGFVETVFGRRLYLTDIGAKSQAARAGAERAAINAPMQGTAADIIKRAMIEVDAWLATLGGAAAMVLQVHDELVLEVREDAVDDVVAGLRERMSGAAALAVPLDVDVGVGANWDEAH